MDTDRNYNSGRGGGGRGRGRNQGGGGRGNYQNQPNQGGGRGNYQNQPNQGGGGGRGNYQNQPNQGGGGGRGNFQNQPNQGGGDGRGSGRGPYNQPSGQNQWVNRPPVQANQPPPQQQYRPPPQRQQPHQIGVDSAVGRTGAWTGRPWGPSPPPTTPPVRPLPPPQTPAQPFAENLDIQKLNISEKRTLPSSSQSKGNQFQIIKRPDRGGTLSVRSIKLLVNHFRVGFDPKRTIIHYDVDVQRVSDDDSRPMKKKLRKSDLRLIKDKLFADDAQMQAFFSQIVYDNEKNIFSAVHLPTGDFTVDIPEGEDLKSGSYTFTIKCVNVLKLSKLNDYIRGTLSDLPRDVLQGMDLVMKENPMRTRIACGRGFYSKVYNREDDLGCGVAAYKGFQQSLKPTSQGPILCLDYSVISFRKPLPVIEFLQELIPGYTVGKTKMLRREVEDALKNLKVTVTHRRTNQKYIIAGLSKEDARDTFFDLVDPEGERPTERTNLVAYFRTKWERDIVYQDIPCVELGKRSNKVPMEFCVLVEGQRFPKELLDKLLENDRDAGFFLKELTIPKPWKRRDTINETVRAANGPCGDVMENFGIGVDRNMTRVLGRVIGAPELKVGASRTVKVDAEKCQWSLVGKSLVDGKAVERWVMLDCTGWGRNDTLRTFSDKLRDRCITLGIRMEKPLLLPVAKMNEYSSVTDIENILKRIMADCGRINPGKLQLIVCVLKKNDPVYKNLKWVSENRIGVVTQCCLSNHAFPRGPPKGEDQYLANLCLKINAKLGGSNFELTGRLPNFDIGDHVMFIGADVNHPAAKNISCPSIAAVVGTINWPAANRYAARVSPQARRCERIVNFGSICLDLVNTYARINKVKPSKIVVFRDGVSEGQFEMVLTELVDLKNSIYDAEYRPPITVVVAQKRHQTRLFPETRNDGGPTGNVPPGTVVDTTIVHPRDFDFYLCSHYGGIGTSKPTHYYALWDENYFTSDQLQKLIYDMCFTFARCTKPVSLVPPVYYADLVAYRGRLFHEAMMNAQSSSSSAGSDFDPSFYSLHRDLENVMFFV